MSWIVLLLILALTTLSATQDVAMDSYSVGLVNREEEGVMFGPRADNFAGIEISGRVNPRSGSGVYYQRMLLYILDLIRQSGRHACPRDDQYVCRHRAAERAAVCLRTDFWWCSGNIIGALAGPPHKNRTDVKFFLAVR